MANFVEFKYDGKMRHVNINKVSSFCEPYPKLNSNNGETIWVVDVLMDNHTERYFLFDTQEEAKALYDLLCGKSETVNLDLPTPEESVVTRDELTDEQLDYILKIRLYLANTIYLYDKSKTEEERQKYLQEIFDGIKGWGSPFFAKPKDDAMDMYNQCKKALKEELEPSIKDPDSIPVKIECKEYNYLDDESLAAWNATLNDVLRPHKEILIKPYKDKLDRIREVVNSFKQYSPGVYENILYLFDKIRAILNEGEK